jgi:hypothetical protein
LIEYTNRSADLGIPRTQAERTGSGLGARRPNSRAIARSSESLRRPRSYAADLRRHRRDRWHRTRPRGRARWAGATRPGRGRLRPGQKQASVIAPGYSCGRARYHLLEPGGSGRVGPTLRFGPYTGRLASPAAPARRRAAARGMEANRAIHGVLDRRSRIAAAVPALAVMDRAAERTAGPGLSCVDRRGPRASSLWGRRARSARPCSSGCHLGHPPVHWIAGLYLHRGPVASRRVPYGGADPGLCCRAWIARGSVTERATGQLLSAPRASPPGPWLDQVWSASGPGPVSTAARVRPQVRGPGRHTGPGPSPAPPQVG